MTPEAALARFREYMVGPARFMNLLSCFELGIIDALRENPGMTAAKLGDAVGATPDAVEQLLHLLIKEEFVSYDEGSGAYSLDVLAGVAAEHKDLRESWATLMDNVTARIDPWFFDNIDIPSGSQVLDLAGNTGLGAIHTYKLKASPGLRVTTFDLPEKEKECLENFRTHGVDEHCSFIGGDVFEEVPKGFDVVLIKHFLDMFDKSEVFKIFDGVNRSLDVGGQVNILVPVYPENIKDSDSYTVDFFPTFFLGCTMARAGHRSCRRTEVGRKKVGSLLQRRLPRIPPTYHRIPSPYTASCARRRPHDQAEFRHPRRRRLSPRSSPAGGSPTRSRCDAPPSRSYGVHQSGVPRHCGVLRGAASGDFTYRK